MKSGWRSAAIDSHGGVHGWEATIDGCWLRITIEMNPVDALKRQQTACVMLYYMEPRVTQHHTFGSVKVHDPVRLGVRLVTINERDLQRAELNSYVPLLMAAVQEMMDRAEAYLVEHKL